MDEISEIRRQFLAVTPLNDFNWNLSDVGVDLQLKCDIRWQELVISSTIKNPLLKLYPISQQYVKRFIKTLISMLENSRVDPILDELYELCASSMSSGSVDEPFFYKIYYITEDDYVVMKESCSFVVNGSTGLVSWQAGKALAEWASCNKHLLKNKVVLELGCGSGLTGISISKTCEPSSYIFTDSHPHVIIQLKHNISINFKDKLAENLAISGEADPMFGSSVVVSEFDWQDEAAVDQLKAKHKPNVILAADVVYDVTIIPSLVEVLRCFLSSSAEIAYVACTVRCEDTLNAFINHIEKSKLKWQTMKCPLQLFHYDKQWKVQIFQIYH